MKSSFIRRAPVNETFTVAGASLTLCRQPPHPGSNGLILGRSRYIIAAALVALAMGTSLRAADDTLVTIDKKTVKGEIKSMSKNEVTLEKVGGGEVTFKTPEIELIRFAG